MQSSANPEANVETAIVLELSVALLADPPTELTLIRVNNEEGIVTLTGQVSNQEVRRIAGEIASSHPGVASAVNYLEVTASRLPQPQRPEDTENLRPKEKQRMSYRLSCSDLGIHNCDWVVAGETAGDVIEQVVDRLRKEHDVRLPDAQTILAGDLDRDPIGDDVDLAADVIVERLREKLNLQGTGGTAGVDLDIDPGRWKSP